MNLSDPVNMAINKYSNHPSIIAIKTNCLTDTKHSFSAVSLQDIQNIVQSIDVSKATASNSIPAGLFKDNIDLYIDIITNIVNKGILECTFPNLLKLADLIPAYKNGDVTDKSNYRPISLLPAISKLFEKLYAEQINKYMHNYFSKYLCGFRRGLSTQYCLLLMIEKIKKPLDKKECCGLLLTDLSKAFDCVKHDLLIAKMHAYNFDRNALLIIHSYLSERKQRTKINSSFSTWHDITVGVPQGSTLGPLLFNIFINDIFYIVTDVNIVNFADDNSPYVIKESMDEVLRTLEQESNKLYFWYKMNFLKPNADKYHLLLSSHDKNLQLNINYESVNNNNEEKILGVTFDNDFSCKVHVKNICRKASKKLHALYRVCKYMTQHQRRKVMKAFIDSQFGYCPLVWIFHGNRTLNNTINKIQERALRLVYKDYHSTYDALLEKDGSFRVHHRHLQILATEIYKFKNNLGPEIINDIFEGCPRNYNLRKDKIITTRCVKSVYNGTETVSFRAQNIWDITPEDLKKASSLPDFKLNIKKWKPDSCTCRLCKEFVTGVGFC